MAHDVFVSYSSKDKTIVVATVATLEKSGLRCWVEPRGKAVWQREGVGRADE
jgi:hypothetical protein